MNVSRPCGCLHSVDTLVSFTYHIVNVKRVNISVYLDIRLYLWRNFISPNCICCFFIIFVLRTTAHLPGSCFSAFKLCLLLFVSVYFVTITFLLYIFLSVSRYYLHPACSSLNKSWHLNYSSNNLRNFLIIKVIIMVK